MRWREKDRERDRERDRDREKERQRERESSNTVRARVPWPAQPYIMLGKFVIRGLLLCLESM